MGQQQLDSNYVLRELSQSLRDDQLDDGLKGMKDTLPSFSSELTDFLKESFKDYSREVGTKMCEVNPRIILKNHYLHKVIEDAEQEDYSSFEELFEILP